MAKTDNSFTTSCEFDAPVEKVFDAWTKVEQLSKWFAPEDYSLIFAESKISPGGVSHYCMTSEHGIEMWNKLFYKQIIPPAKIVYTQCFSNNKGGIERHPMNPGWPLEIQTTVMLDDKGGKTLLKLTLEPINARQEEITTFIDGVFELNQSWGGTFEQLAEYLANN